MGRVQRRIVRGVLAVVEHPKATLAIAAALLVACTTWAYFRLDISTDTNKLFSPKVKFFADYLEYHHKFPENEAIYVLIQAREAANPPPPPPLEKWTAAADAVVDRLKRMSEHVASVHARVPIEKLGDQGLLFEDPQRVHEVTGDARRFAQLIKVIAERPSLIERTVLGPTPIDRFFSAMLAAAPDAESAPFVGAVAQSLVRTLDQNAVQLPDLARMGASSPRDLGYSYVPDATDPARHILLVQVNPVPKFDSVTAISETVEAIRAGVAEVAPKFAEFSFGVTGRPALDADEMRSTDRDSSKAEIVAVIVVFIGLMVSLKSVWLAVVAEICLGVGIGWTFGWAELAVGELNLLSIVFLIALIGIGMDYLVQILVRYRQEALRHVRAFAVWARVFRHVGPPINTACLGAAGAFLVAVFTDFRGAAQLGIIAGGGLLLCLLSGHTVMPALLTLFPGRFSRVYRQRQRAVAAGSSAGEANGSSDDDEDEDLPPLPPRHVIPARSGGWRLLMPLAWAVLLLVGVLLYVPRTGFNPNLIELQAQNLESVQLIRKLQSFSAVVLSKDLDVLRRTREAMKDLPTVAGTDSILVAYDNAEWLAANAKIPEIKWAEPTPLKAGDVSRIADKARSLGKKYAGAIHAAPAADRPALQGAANALAAFALRADVPAQDQRAAADTAAAAAERLSEWQRGFIEQLKAMLRQFNPGPPRISDLPSELRGHYVADDGTMALYILPKADLWNREALGRFVREVETTVHNVPGAPEATGIASNIYHTTASIERSFYRSAAYALGLIFLLVLLDLRSIVQTLLAMSVLVLGLPMLVSIMGLLDVDWNFANFFGLPILIGAGHEYGVFMVHRYREACQDPRRYWRWWDASDKALLLCAYVTCSSFGFFWWFADHRGLKSLGLVMALGTLCIYLASLVVVRPLLLWLLRRCDARKTDPPMPPS
jgi:hopanoid biosynthesis associated RND transporter like protein HpnN